MPKKYQIVFRRCNSFPTSGFLSADVPTVRRHDGLPVDMTILRRIITVVPL
jgi:hypothetical protein